MASAAIRMAHRFLSFGELINASRMDTLPTNPTELIKRKPKPNGHTTGSKGSGKPPRFAELFI